MRTQWIAIAAPVVLAGCMVTPDYVPPEISVPDQYVGDIMGDISSRRGKVQSSEAQGSSQVIKAQVPMAEMLEYASSLNSVTGGQGEFHMDFSHYDEAPAQVREKVIAEAQAAKAEAS